MKKLMTMIAAVASAFGLYADSLNDVWDASGKTASDWNADSQWTVPADIGEGGAVFTDNTALTLKTGEKLVDRVFPEGATFSNSSNVYFDVNLDFLGQALDELPTIPEGSKLALFVLDNSELGAASPSTKLYALGYNYDVEAPGNKALYELGVDIATLTNSTRRLTVNAYDNILAESTHAGFTVYLDGAAVEKTPLVVQNVYYFTDDGCTNVNWATSHDDPYLGAALSTKLAVHNWYAEKNLLLSLVAGGPGKQFSAISFKGNAAIAKATFTETKPAFIGADFVGMTVTAGSGVSITGTDGYENGVITKDCTLTLTCTDNTITKPVFTTTPVDKTNWPVSGNTIDVTFVAGQTFTVNVAEAAATVTIGEGEAQNFATLADAMVEANKGTTEFPATLALNASDTAANIKVTGVVVLDLNGKTLSANGKSIVPVAVAENASLTIVDSDSQGRGKIANLHSSGSALENAGTALIEAGTFDGYVYNDGGTIKVFPGSKFQASTNVKSEIEAYATAAGTFEVVEEGGYLVVQEKPADPAVEIVGGSQYQTFAEAFSNVTDGATIKFLTDFEGPFRDTAFPNNDPTVVSQYVNGVTIDLNGKTWTMTGGNMARCWEDRCGNSFFFQNGSLKVVSGAANQNIAFYTYAEMLSFDDVALDFSGLAIKTASDDPRVNSVIVSQNGSVKFTGTTTVTLANGQNLVCMLDRASAAYEPGTLTLDVDGELAGDILLYSACKIAAGEGTTLNGKVYTGAAAQSGFEPAGALGSPFEAMVGAILPKTGSADTNTRGGQLFTSVANANDAIATTTFAKNIIVLNDVEADSFAVASGTVNFEIPADVTFTGTTAFTLNGAKVKLVEGGMLVVPAALNIASDFVAPAEGKEIKVAGEGPYTYTVGDAATPVVPGEFEPIPAKDEDDATQRASIINANKADYIKAPDGIDAGEYLKLFAAKPAPDGEGNWQVVVDLTDKAKSDLQVQVDDEVAEAIADITATDATITTTPGLWYAIVGGTEVDTIAIEGTEQMATTESLTLAKPVLGETTKAFYKVRVSISAKQQ